jgi:hypothetical protein
MHQRDVVQNSYPGFLQELCRGRLEEIPVPGAKNIGFTNNRCLHDDSVVYIANRCDQQGIRDHNLGGLAQETDVIVDAFLRKSVERQHARIAQDPGQLVEHLVGEQQNMIELDDTDQEIAGKPFSAAMSSNEYGGVEDDSH